MAEAVGLAASVIAIIDLSAKVANLCFQYSTAVGNARADITCLRTRLDDIGTSLQGVRHLLDGQNYQELATSRELVDSLNGCTSELAQLQSRLDPGKAHKAMRRVGLRALKWPFDSKEVSGIVSSLEHYKQTIMLCLQVDQTTLLLGIRRGIESVSLQLEGSTSIACKPCFSVPFDRDPDFVDRPDAMAWIKEQYTGSGGRMALVGIGGFGLVCDWLQTEEAGSWVMVLDNVDDVNLFYPGYNIGGNEAGCYPAHGNPAIGTEQRPLAAFLPKRRNGTILVASRSMDAAEKLTGSHKAVYRISTMDDAQGLQLLRNKLKGEFDKDSAADLLRALDYIPLAITQAAAYINRRAPRVSIRRERPSAANLLCFMSFFNPQGIPEFVLHNYDTDLADNVDTDAESDDFEDDLDVLRGYSLVSITATRHICEMHSLMLLPHIESLLEEEPPHEDLQNWAGLLTKCTWYMLSIGKYGAAERLGGKAVDKTIKVLGEEHLYTLASMASLASTYRNRGRWKEAEELEVGLIETRKRVLGEEHPDTLTSMANLALIYLKQGRWKKAEELEVGLIEIRKRVLGEEHRDTLPSMASLALTYMTQGRWKEAEELVVGVIEIRTRVLGEEHPDTLPSMADLALTYANQGRWKEAEELQVGLLETRKRVLGEEHPHTLVTMGNLASTYANQGRWKEAEELQVGLLETRKRVLEEEHPHTLTSMHNLAGTWKTQGRTEDALALLRNCVVLRKRVLGVSHPDTASSAAVLAEWENVSALP
ncbi:hypothetical protein DL765_007037 [Monosporascus sp. GIB2]|nr:hypothetical protein DL765_007037 [Monosporascus sp. GIB2]